jgi:DUF2993 family protein
MFIVRKLVVALVVLVGIFLGGSAVLESFAESQLSTGVGRTLGLDTRPAVEIDAFPILLRVVQGRIPRILIDAHDVTIEKLDIAELSIEMLGVRANIDVLISSDRFDLSVEHGTGSARIGEDSVNAFLKSQGRNVHVTFRPDGSVFVRADRVVGGKARRFEAKGKLSLDARKLIFTPSSVTVDGRSAGALTAQARRETAFGVTIPKLPGEILPRQILVADGEVTLVAKLNGYVLRLTK